METNQRFALFTHIDHDLVFVYDPQPLPLITFYQKKQPWIFRCHIDLSAPYDAVWNHLKGLIDHYDHFIVSNPLYVNDVSIPTSIFHPARDPLNIKNKVVPKKTIERYLNKHQVNPQKPLLSQISRFDLW